MHISRYAAGVLVLLGATLFTTAPLNAQKNCHKGIPCGNSCISASKVCRIGSPAAEPMPRYDPPSGNTHPTYVAPTAVISATPVAASAELDQWSGQPHGRVYYRASCQAAKELPEPIYFRTAADAERLGYRRSQVPTC
jgi:hypothetical protein